ncbi:MAG: hypothetical protein GY841_22455 [FCB group bacterium]|nr:hypothetical protein [FCB group bacterium]
MALSGDRYDITGTGARDGDEDVTGGWRAWREMNDSPVLQHQTSAWIDEALTGITPDGKRSKITRAVLSNWKPGVE